MHRLGITNQRNFQIIAIDKKSVTIRHKDYRNSTKQMLVTLGGVGVPVGFASTYCHFDL